LDPRIRTYYHQYDLDRFFATDVLEHFQVFVFEKGDEICNSDEPMGHLFFFVEGRAKVSITLENGRQLLLSFHRPLQLFGEKEILDVEAVATTTIEALTTCICLGLEKSFVLEHLSEDPKFLRQMWASLSKKLDRVIRNSAINTLTALDNRVASYILATAETDADHNLIFTGNLSQIADLLGTSFRHLHRTLQAFCDQGILIKTSTTYTVQSIDELENRAIGVYIV